MLFISISQISRYNDNDPSLKFILNFDECEFCMDSEGISLTTKKDELFYSKFERIEPYIVEHRTDFHFKMNNFEYRIAIPFSPHLPVLPTFPFYPFNTLETFPYNEMESCAIASKRHDNFAIYFNLIKGSESNLLGYSYGINIFLPYQKKIKYETLIPNPLKIVKYDPLGQFHPPLEDYTKEISNDIKCMCSIIFDKENYLSFDNIICSTLYYLVSWLLTYRNNSNYALPEHIVVQFKSQFKIALESIEEFKDLDVAYIKGFWEWSLVQFYLLEEMEKFNLKYGLQEFLSYPEWNPYS